MMKNKIIKFIFATDTVHICFEDIWFILSGFSLSFANTILENNKLGLLPLL